MNDSDPTTHPHENQLCLRCGYDLRAQSLDGECPECGMPVADSLVSLRRFADAPWVRGVAFGCGLFVAGGALGFLNRMDEEITLAGGQQIPLRTIYAIYDASPAAYGAIDTGGMLVMLGSFLLMTAAPTVPGGMPRDWFRTAARWLIAISFPLAWILPRYGNLLLKQKPADDARGAVLSMLLDIALLAGYLCLMAYAMRAAAWLTMPRLRRFIGAVMLLFAAAWLCMLGSDLYMTALKLGWKPQFIVLQNLQTARNILWQVHAWGLLLCAPLLALIALIFSRRLWRLSAVTIDEAPAKVSCK